MQTLANVLLGFILVVFVVALVALFVLYMYGIIRLLCWIINKFF